MRAAKDDRASDESSQTLATRRTKLRGAPSVDALENRIKEVVVLNVHARPLR